MIRAASVFSSIGVTPQLSKQALTGLIATHGHLRDYNQRYVIHVTLYRGNGRLYDVLQLWFNSCGANVLLKSVVDVIPVPLFL